MFVCPRFVALPLQHSLIRLQQHSFFQLLTLENCCPSLPMDHGGLLQKHLFHVLREDHSHVHHHLSFKSKVCRCSHLMPTSRVSHVTVPASPLTCFHRCTSRICPSSRLPAKRVWPRWIVDKSSFTSMKRDNPKLLPSDLSTFIFLRARLPHTLARTKPILSNFLAPTHMLFSESLLFLTNENFTSHFFLLAFPFAPSCFVLVLESTPHDSTLVARPTPLSCATFLILHFPYCMTQSPCSAPFPSFRDRQLQTLVLHHHADRLRPPSPQ